MTLWHYSHNRLRLLTHHHQHPVTVTSHPVHDPMALFIHYSYITHLLPSTPTHYNLALYTRPYGTIHTLPMHHPSITPNISNQLPLYSPLYQLLVAILTPLREIGSRVYLCRVYPRNTLRGLTRFFQQKTPANSRRGPDRRWEILGTFIAPYRSP